MGKITKIVAILLISLSSNNLFSQGIKASYEITFKSDSASTNLEKQTYILKIDGKENNSLFYPEKFGLEDSFNQIVYKDLAKNTYLKYQTILNIIYKTEIKSDSTWDLFKDKKQILGYTCNNAKIGFGGRTWIAWYTTDLPFHDGPYLFHGLPGLIVAMSSEDGDYNFQMVSMQKSEESIRQPKGILLANKDEENKVKTNIIKNPSSQYQQNVMSLKGSGIGMSVSFNGKERTDKDIADNIDKNFFDWMKKHNNPIEKGDIWIK